MIRFDDRVAIVTGAGVGLGRSHALGLAGRGAKVVINDLGVGQDGQGQSSGAAFAVVAEIEAMGGTAFAHGADVSNADQVGDMVAQTMERWGRIDILVNNAGILLDKTFAKMPMEDFRKVVNVHLLGSANCCHAVWPIMRQQKFGRIVLTSSRDDIRINTLAPTAATRMTENLLPPEALKLLAPETITPGLLYLVSDDGPSKTILSAGAGCFAQTRIYETQGTIITGDITPEAVAQNWNIITDPTDQEELQDAFSQTRKYAKRAAEAHKIKLDW